MMNILMNKYLKQLIVVILALVVIIFAWNFFFRSLSVAPWWPFYLAFFVIVTVIIHFLFLNSFRKKPKKFIGVFMIVTLSKLFLFMVVLFLNVIYTPFHKASVIAPFLLFYITFTLFEVKHLIDVAGGKSNGKTQKKITNLDKENKQ
jgi:hypothetical protein